MHTAGAVIERPATHFVVQNQDGMRMEEQTGERRTKTGRGRLKVTARISAAASALRGERWLPIPGYESIYKISNAGRVQRKGYIVRTFQAPSITGSWMVVLHARPRPMVRRRVCEVVWETWVGPIPEGRVVSHRNGRLNDNRLANLLLRSDAEYTSFQHAVTLITQLRRLKQAVVAAGADNQPTTNEALINLAMEACYPVAEQRRRGRMTSQVLDPGDGMMDERPMM